MRHVILFVLVSAGSFALFLANYLGVFKSVVISEAERGPYIMIYLDHMGPYHKTVSSLEKVEAWAKEKGLDCRLSFGEYFDNPEVVEENRLKSRAGCLLPQSSDQIPPLPPDFQMTTLAQQKFVVAEFSGSPGIGPMKVYPKVSDYIEQQRKKQKGSVIEIYEIINPHEKNSMRTTYLFKTEAQ